MALTKVTYSMIDGINAINVNDYGADDTGATFSDAAFNLAIAEANTQGAFLYIPPGQYKTQSTLTTITGPGILGSTAGSPVIRHYSPNDLFIVYGPYKKVIGIRLLNMTAAGAGTVNGALLKLRNCWYGYFQDIYAAHDLDDYSGICFEQNYSGSVDDAYFLVHGGVWYNTAINLSAVYNVFGSARGYGVTLRVNANALGVVNPPGEPAGTYSGSVSNNQIIGSNIEGKLNGLRMDTCTNNIIMGGQFLGCTIQVRVINGRQNQFLQTKHNQWTSAPFQIDGASSGKNLINYPTVTNPSLPLPWSLGTLTATDEVRHVGEGTINNQAFASTVSFTNEATVSGIVGNVPTYSWLGDNNDGGNNLLKIRYTGNVMSWDVYNETTGAFVRTALEQGNGVATARFLQPGADDLYSLGTSAKRWTEVFAAAPTINTSDEREKTFLTIEDAERAAALEIKDNLRKFKFNTAIAKKGESARIHFGVAAQQVGQIMQSHGLDPHKYGFFCYDEWETDVEKGIEAGNIYGIRYEELLCFIMAAI